jgi:hypothetical protein
LSMILGSGTFWTSTLFFPCQVVACITQVS